MVTNTSIVVESVDNNDVKISRSFGYIKPTATDAQIRTFATGIYRLSNQTLTAVYKIVRSQISLTEESNNGGHDENAERLSSDGTF